MRSRDTFYNSALHNLFHMIHGMNITSQTQIKFRSATMSNLLFDVKKKKATNRLALISDLLNIFYGIECD